tara:strand:- start:23 stop:640 length:618 start_codon:yes stop_codon:yes gene_type:complete
MNVLILRKKPVVLSLCGLGLVAHSLAAGAQQLEEVLVTAQKRVESLQDVPVAVNSFSSDSLSVTGTAGVENLAMNVPGLSISRHAAASMVFVRGIGTPGGQAGLDSAVSLFQDGVLLPSLAGATLKFNNLERVEVLKGPQGTLYGRNATGGAINIITKDPNPNGEGSFQIGYGNYDTLETNAYLAGALGENIAADIAVVVSLNNP